MKRGVRLSSFLLRQETGLSQQDACALGLLICDAHDLERLVCLSPEQVLFTEGRVELLRHGPRREGEPPVSPSGLDWMTPESLVDAAHEPARTVVFNVAALVVTALLMDLPLEAATEADRYDSLRLARIKPLASLRRDLTASLLATLARALRCSPADRFAHLSDLREAFRQECADPEQAQQALFERVFEGASAELLPMVPESAGGEAGRLVTADGLEAEGRLDEAKWLQLESRARTLADEATALELSALTPRLEASFVGRLARAPLSRCGLLNTARCPNEWASLTPTADPLTRRCAQCDFEARLCLSQGEFERSRGSGRVCAVPTWSRT